MAVVVLTAILVYYKDSGVLDPNKLELNKTITQKTYDNYGRSVKKASDKYNLPPDYLLALIALECSGRKLVPHRFEPHIFNKLDQVARGVTTNLEHVTAKELNGSTHKQMRAFASSWGPFQIMGYKCFEINTDVAGLKGSQSVMLGSKWIAQSYGALLAAGDFKSAFHLHNTGQTYPKFGPPKTYHRDYVPRGLKYMEAFREILTSDSLKRG